MKAMLSDKSEVFVRWRARTGGGLGPFSDMTYSFHFGHLFEDVPLYILGESHQSRVLHSKYRRTTRDRWRYRFYS